MILFAIFFISTITCGNSLDPFMFEVKNPNQTIQFLKQFDYGNMSLYLTLDILTKLNLWERRIFLNPLLFENPATNFLLLKMLWQDIQEDMIPSYLRKQFKISVKIPTKNDLQKSATILNDMMEMYGISRRKGITIIYLWTF